MASCEVAKPTGSLSNVDARFGGRKLALVSTPDGRVSGVVQYPPTSAVCEDAQEALRLLRREMKQESHNVRPDIEVVDWKSGQVVSPDEVAEGPVMVRAANALVRSVSSPLLSPPRGKEGTLSSLPKLVEGGVCELATSRRGGVRRLAEAVLRGLDAGHKPVLENEGLGGTYLLRGATGERLAMVKPLDEEPFAPHNPKGYVGRQLGEPGMVRAIRVGEAGVREVAAFLLDHGHFSRVPRTALVSLSHPLCCFHVAPPVSKPGGGGVKGAQPPAQRHFLPVKKLGSLQEYVRHDYDASEHGTSRFPPSEVHRLGLLDLRLYNTDRHTGNILVRKVSPSRVLSTDRADALPSGSGALAAAVRTASFDASGCVELVPIDHGYSLPETLEPVYFEWLHWPQASMPFGAEALEYIAALDPLADADMLRAELSLLREPCIRLLQMTTILIKTAAAASLTLADIGNMMSRPLVGIGEEPSELERLVIASCDDVAAAAAAGPDGLAALAAADASDASEGGAAVDERDELELDDDDDDEEEDETKFFGGDGVLPSPSSGSSVKGGCDSDAKDSAMEMQFELEAGDVAAPMLAPPRGVVRSGSSSPLAIPPPRGRGAAKEGPPGRASPAGTTSSGSFGSPLHLGDSFNSVRGKGVFASPAREPKRPPGILVAASASPGRPGPRAAAAAVLHRSPPAGTTAMGNARAPTSPAAKGARSFIQRPGGFLLRRQMSRRSAAPAPGPSADGGVASPAVRSEEPGSPAGGAGDNPAAAANAFASLTPEQWQAFLAAFSERVLRAVESRRRAGPPRFAATGGWTGAALGTSCPRW